MSRPSFPIPPQRPVEVPADAAVPTPALDVALDRIPEAVVITDAGGAVVFWSAAASNLYGYTSEQAVGQRLKGLILPLVQQPEVREALDHTRGAERATTGSWLTRSRDGDRFWVTASSSPLPDTRGRTGYTLTVISVTDERSAAPQSAPRLANLVDSSPDAVLAAHIDGRIFWVNGSTEDVLGWARDDLIGMHLSLLTSEADRPEQERMVADVLQGLPVPPFTTRWRRRDGSLLEVSETWFGMRDHDGGLVAVSAVIHDMTRHVEPRRDVDRQEALFSALSRRSSDVAIVTDAETNILYASDSATNIFGYDREENIGMSGWSFLHPDDHGDVRSALDRAIADPDHIERVTVRIRDKRGQWRWVEETITNLLSEPNIEGLVANMRDVTDRVQAEAQLRSSEARYRAIAETAQEGIGVLSPTGRTLFANPKLAEILGLSLAQTYRTSIIDLFGAEMKRRLEERLEDRADTRPMMHESSYHHPDGSERILSISAVPLPLDTGRVGSLAMVSDVTAERRAEQELRRRALHDVLTDLPNRALLSDRMHMAMARHDRTVVGTVALIFLDLDQFKAVNDSLGHDAGDLLLIEIAARLQHVVRANDTVARLGGDEFAVLCEDIDEHDAMLLAQRLRSAVSGAIELEGHRIFVDASIGLAFSPPQDLSTLLRSADTAMYRAKADGRGRIRVFDSTVASSADRKLTVMSRLRESLRTGIGTGTGLNLHYQPIMDLRTNTVTGAEALLRWHDERLGRVSPSEVVAAAESTGLTFALDEWVLGRACAELASLRSAGIHPDIHLSVNLCAQNIGATSLDELVRQVSESSGWPAGQLTVEVTESALMTDPESAAELLGILRDLGVSVAVDDFGTGYSSFAYLQRLPVSVLKIDPSFVDSVTTDSDSLAIATSIIDLARGLGLHTVAEGIETPEQARVMRDLGCTRGQGYLWSPAIPLGALGDFAFQA